MVDLGTLGGGGSTAFAINNSGQIVGTGQTSSGQFDAFLYSGGVMQDLGALGGISSAAFGINSSGQVAGQIETPGGQLNAFLYSGGVMQNLGTLGGSNSQANGINDAGVVVGTSGTADGNEAPFIYSNGVMTDLNSLVSLPNTILWYGAGINNLGQIIATGLAGRAYLLTPASIQAPTPTPTPTPSPTPIPPAPTAASAMHLTNLSTRAYVGTQGNVAIAGFVVSGSSGTKQVLIRGVGPTLVQFSVTGFLAQPVLTLFNSSGTKIASNTAWGTNPNPLQLSAAFTAAGAFVLPSGSADSALLLSLAPGSYTAEVSGLNNTTGTALIEVYEVPVAQ